MNQPVHYRARWLVPEPGAVIDGGELTIVDRQIVRVGPSVAGRAAIDLGDVAILPPLVNCHAHLEFSGYEAPLGAPGIAFTDWLRLVIADQWARREGPPQVAVQWRVQGWDEAVSGGAAWVADVTTVAEPWQDHSSNSTASPIGPSGHLPMWEVLGATPSRAEAAWQRATDMVAGWASARTSRRWGLSPHAPYSTSWPLVARSCAVSAAEGVPLAMHLAESREELELLAAGTGPFRTLLEDLGAWSEETQPRSVSIHDYLTMLASAHRGLVVHGNYLSQPEADLLAQHRHRMTLVYCPRTHAYFGHDPYPLAKRVQGGVRMVLGTDSRASNPDLSLWREWQFAAATHPAVDPWRVLQMVTTDAAWALGIGHRAGRLAAGLPAQFLVVRLHDSRGDQPLIERLLGADGPELIDLSQVTSGSGRVPGSTRY